MKTSKYIKLITTIVCANMFFFPMALTYAKVDNISEIGDRLGDLDRLKIVKAKCYIGSDEYWLIFNRIGESRWCSVDIPSRCSGSRNGAAFEVCKNNFRLDIEEYSKGKQNDDVSPSVSSPQSTLISEQSNSSQDSVELDEFILEKEKITLEMEQLELRRQELELNKQRLKLERQSAGAQ